MPLQPTNPPPSLKIKNRIIETEHTALGNNILANDFGCIASGDFTASARQKISNALCVEVEAGTIAKYKTVGSFAVANNKGCIAHLESSRLEIRKIEKLSHIHTLVKLAVIPIYAS